MLLCIVKSSSLSSTIKVLEPIDMSQRGKKQPTPFRKLLNNGSAHNEPFKVMKVRHLVVIMRQPIDRISRSRNSIYQLRAQVS